MSPASGLVSILKKRSVRVDNLSTSPTSESQPDKPTAKRRVRFKVPGDDYEQGVCLFLLRYTPALVNHLTINIQSDADRINSHQPTRLNT